LGRCVYGQTEAVSITVQFRACLQNGQWCAILESVTGHYAMQTRLLPGQTEVTGPNGNTTLANFCDQVTELNALGFCNTAQWYMLAAVVDHEHIHEQSLLPALLKQPVLGQIQ